VDFRGVLRGNPDLFRASDAPLVQSSDRALSACRLANSGTE
jgi:hypothetical protein